ncbi:HupE/UreJ family protein [Limnobacter alexandrii]|uniref:HupE/UreJ family protein n=1 Tax=Limnobacter alexandrii TaxID=2570352 RepID=UPI001107E253|nr:HupE/UreJ family protein [Limnobacter alexandrii]
MNRLAFAFVLCMGLHGAPGTGHAHEMGTSALIVHESTQGTGQFVFKRTVGSDDKIPPVDFQFSPACELRDVSTEWEGNTELIQRGNFFCSKTLAEHDIDANGFTRLAPDLIVLATPLQGDRIHAVLTPKQASLSLGDEIHQTPPLEYLSIGIEHIVFGLDHVLFVTGLYLLWKKREQNLKQLIGQFTLFTVGHSLTLALLVLGWIAVPTRAIEAWIALSVLWLAWELVRKEPARQSNWSHLLLIAAFGLLHGSGFALSMEERGFPEDALLSTLLLFNIGIEIGQLWIVTVLATAFALLEKTHLPNSTRLAQHALTLCIGGAALYWTIERIHSYV